MPSSVSRQRERDAYLDLLGRSSDLALLETSVPLDLLATSDRVRLAISDIRIAAPYIL